MNFETVAPGIIRFFQPFGPRRLAYFGLLDAAGVTVFDAGLPGSVTRRIDDGSCPMPITRVIISHADADHLGDAAAIQARCPDAELLCHPADRRWIEDHEALVRERYGEAAARYGHPAPHLPLLRTLCGPDCRVTGELTAGMRLTIGGRNWEVLHLPGHSLGHVALWHQPEGILLMADAVLGAAIPDSNSQPSMPPAHRYIGEYLETIQHLAQLPVRLALSAHWPPLDGSGFRALVGETRDCVLRDLSCLRSACAARRSFAELIDVLNTRFRTWPSAADGDYALALTGYLEHLLAEGALIEDAEGWIAA